MEQSLLQDHEKEDLIMQNFKSVIFVVALLSVLTTSCTKEEDVTERCPTCEPVITWTTYGSLNLQKAAYNGFFNLMGQGDLVVSLFIDCGWEIYENRRGGNQGRPFAVTNCAESVVMHWEDEKFQFMELDETWDGSTEAGIAMGATIESFLSTYPEFVEEFLQPDMTTLVFNDDRYKVTAFFDLDSGVLSKLRVERQ